MTLKSMVEYTLETCELLRAKTSFNGIYREGTRFGLYLDKLESYAKFLLTLLELWMFVPVGDDGAVLERPQKHSYWDPTEPLPEEIEQEYYDFDKAKSRVLFKGFKVNQHDPYKRFNIVIISNGNHQITFFASGEIYYDNIKDSSSTKIICSIENLTGLGIELTDNAIEKFGL